MRSTAIGSSGSSVRPGGRGGRAGAERRPRGFGRRWGCGEGAAAREVCRAALALGRGDAMADIESSYLRRPHAVPLEELRLTALEERVELDLRLGRGGEVARGGGGGGGGG